MEDFINLLQMSCFVAYVGLLIYSGTINPQTGEKNEQRNK